MEIRFKTLYQKGLKLPNFVKAHSFVHMPRPSSILLCTVSAQQQAVGSGEVKPG